MTVKAATDVRQFRDFRITRAIYATAWDGTIVFEVDKAGRLTLPSKS